MKMNIIDYDTLFSKEGYIHLGKFQWIKTIKNTYTLTIIANGHSSNRSASIKVKLTSNYLNVNKSYFGISFENIIDRCKEIEEKFTNDNFIKLYNELIGVLK